MYILIAAADLVVTYPTQESPPEFAEALIEVTGGFFMDGQPGTGTLK